MDAKQYRYTSTTGKTIIDGRELKTGDVVLLSDTQAKNFKDKFKMVDAAEEATTNATTDSVTLSKEDYDRLVEAVGQTGQTTKAEDAETDENTKPKTKAPETVEPPVRRRHTGSNT